MSEPKTEALRSTFPSYMAEGERLYLCGEFSKAALSFSNALRLQNSDKNCLVARSKCFLKMGELEKSLKDAEASLEGDPTFCKGILQKAETLYTMGDFEFALVFYHRGYKLRPDREFKVGIQKAQEAINNSVGSPSSIKLENKGDLSFLSKQAENMKALQKPQPVRHLLYHPETESKRKGSLKSKKTVRQLLGELYVDKEYLEKLLLDEVLTSGSAEGSLQKAEKVLKKVLEWNKEDVPNKDELVGNLYSCMGNAQIELGQMVAALQSHRKDLEIAKEQWEEKIPLAKTTLEKTWLFHEIGRCYLELDQAWQAQSYGEKSQQCAEEEGDIEWQLNASVLVAQAQVKLRDFESAVNNFEKALEKAKLVHNNEAQQAIISALDDANKGIIGELKKTNYRDLLKEKKEKEEAAELDNTSAMTREKETVRRDRGRPEKMIKQWERRQTDNEKDTEDDLSNEAFTTTGSEEEEKGQRKKGSSLRELEATGRDSGDIAKGLSRELAIKRLGEAGRELSEVSRRESREIYRPSDLDQKFSEDLIGRQSKELRERLSEAGRRESEELEEIESGEIGEMNTENAGKMEKGEKEDE
ncbi:outer dynein arm-docking complex subunit 4 isoform 5-T5 [Hipposideros larvatus]